MLDITKPLILHSAEFTANAPEFQCDCACVSTIPLAAKPQPIRADTPYVLNRSFHVIALSTECTVGVTALNTPFVMNQAALEICAHFQEAQTIDELPLHWIAQWGHGSVQETLCALIDLNVVLPAGQADSRQLVETPTSLSAWLHITDSCNLRCAYCYLPHKRKDMTWEIGTAAVDATLRSAKKRGYDTVKLKYAGGEPLLRFPFVVELHKYAQEQAARRRLTLGAVVLSNGTMLTPEIVAQLKTLELRLMVSLDGLGAVHNGQRFYANGHGSFTDVVRGIEHAVALGTTPEISVTVTGRNASELPKLVPWLLDRGLPFGLNFYRENDFSASFADLKLEEQVIIDGMRAAFRQIEQRMPTYSLLAALVDRADLSNPHLRTCSVGDSYLVFDYAGQVSKCQMHMSAPVTDVHAQDPLGLIRADKIGIQNLSIESKEGCRDCEWRYWCTGGCPLMTFRATGRYDVQSPNCSIYKALFPEVVRLEGLRLLQQAGFTV